MSKKALTAEMKTTLRNKLEGSGASFKQGTLKSLADRGLIDTDDELTLDGWKQAVVLLPLLKQCAHLGIAYERLEGLEFNAEPEYAAWKHFNSQGYVGAYCEGGPILLLIRAAALDTLAKLNPFNSREDACSRFTEAQLKIHENHSEEILNAVRIATPGQIARGFKEIYASLMVQESYPGLTVEVMVALFNSLGSERLAQITYAIMEDPYQYRSGWPDLIMTNGARMLWSEIKTTDRLHMSQITTLHRMKSLLPGEIGVSQLC